MSRIAQLHEVSDIALYPHEIARFTSVLYFIDIEPVRSVFVPNVLFEFRQGFFAF
jgi:hypothetical protein